MFCVVYNEALRDRYTGSTAKAVTNVDSSGGKGEQRDVWSSQPPSVADMQHIDWGQQLSDCAARGATMQQIWHSF